jgi:hypothetical protein
MSRLELVQTPKAAEQAGAVDGPVLAQAVLFRARQGSRRLRRHAPCLSRAGTASASPRPATDRRRSIAGGQEGRRAGGILFNSLIMLTFICFAVG